MSAFLVSKRHIDVLVAGRYLDPHGPNPATNADDLGRMLWRENMASIAARYPQDAIDEVLLATYMFDPGVKALILMRRIPVVHVIKAIHCYEYQACEHDGWERSDARHYCERLMQICTHALPGYDSAPWGIE